MTLRVVHVEFYQIFDRQIHFLRITSRVLLEQLRGDLRVENPAIFESNTWPVRFVHLTLPKNINAFCHHLLKLCLIKRLFYAPKPMLYHFDSVYGVNTGYYLPITSLFNRTTFHPMIVEHLDKQFLQSFRRLIYVTQPHVEETSDVV